MISPIHNSCLNPITDKQFIALGFGGLVNGRVRHCFPLNGNPRQPQCRGIEGVIQAYYHSLQNGEALSQIRLILSYFIRTTDNKNNVA